MDAAVVDKQKKRALDLLDIISHATANEGEALNAARALGTMRDKVGGFEKLFATSAAGIQPAAPPMSFNESRRRHTELEEERDRLVARVRDLEGRISRLTVEKNRFRDEAETLRSAVKKNLTTASDGTMVFNDFALKVRQILGKAWQQEFIAQTNIDPNMISRMSRNQIVPPEIVSLIPTLTPAAKARFSPLDVGEIRRWARHHDDAGIAKLATERLNAGIVTRQLIRKLRIDLRGGNTGYGDPAYGGPLPTLVRNVEHVASRKRERKEEVAPRNEAFQWEKFPDIETLVCENYASDDRKSAREMAEFVSEQSGVPVYEGTIKQRLNNAQPPASLVKKIKGTGRLTFLEFWHLGSMLAKKRAWMTPTMRLLGIDEKEIQRVREIVPTLPVAKADALRRMAREGK